MNDFDNETTACISCFTPNQPNAAFCEKCGLPLDVSGSLDPMRTIQAEGFLLRKAVTLQHPNFIVLLGIWILFLPWLLVSLLIAVSSIANGKGFADFIFFWSAVALALFAIVMLFRVTKNYLTMPNVRHQDMEKDAQ